MGYSLWVTESRTAARQASLSFTISQSLHKLMSTESVMPSNHLILCCFLLLLPLFPSIRVFSNESALCIRWLKYCSFSFNISLFNDYSGLTISFLSNKLSRIFSSTTVQKHHFFGAQPSLWSNSHPYMTTGKTIALTIQTFVIKVMSLLFNPLSRFIIAFLPSCKCLLVSWLQSPSTVSLEPKKIVSLCFHCFPIY